MNSLETPAYIVKKEVLVETIELFQKSLNKYFKKNIFSYSLKTNSMPYILDCVRMAGGYAEVVSKDEYELAKLAGFEIDRIVYNGPLKSKETFLEAIVNGAVVNIETSREIDWLGELPENKLFAVGIRANIDLAVISPEDAKENEDYSRFGFTIENGELKKAIFEIAKYKNVSLTGLHVHRTTLSRSVEVYSKVAGYIGKITKDLSLSLSYIDIGGGFYGIMDGKPTFDDYFSKIRAGLDEVFDVDSLTVVVEPGNAIVASAIDFITSVIDVKKIRDFHIITTDGSRNDIDPFYKKKSYFNSIIYNSDACGTSSLQIVSGGTCLEYDKIFEVKESRLLAVNDKILYLSVGAYTMTLSPLFIRFFPKIYLESNGEYKLIREAWAASDFFDLYNTNFQETKS